MNPERNERTPGPTKQPSPVYEAQLGEDGKVFFSVVGEEEQASDITAFVAPLLAAPPLEIHNTPTNQASDDLSDAGGNEVDFATISCTENVSFTQDGEPVSQQVGLQVLSDRIVDALRRSLCD